MTTETITQDERKPYEKPELVELVGVEETAAGIGTALDGGSTDDS